MQTPAFCLLVLLIEFSAGHRFRRSHKTVVFPRDDPYSCTTPYRQPGVCVPMEACPDLRRVGLRRLSKFLCGFGPGDIPLLCCDRHGLAPPPPPPLLSPPPSTSTLLPNPSTTLAPNNQVNPIPILCSVSVHEGRRLKSCWYLTLQRVVFDDDEQPLLPEAPLSPPVDETPSSPPVNAPDQDKQPPAIGATRPSKTSVVSD